MTDTKHLPKKTRYYTISAGSGYEKIDLFYFKELNGAMEMFKFLQKGEALKVESESIKIFTKKADSDGDHYTFKYYNYEDQAGSEFHLTSKIMDIFTREQIRDIKKIEAKKITEADAKKPKKKGKKK